MGHNIIPMCSSKQVCNGELPLLHHNCGDYRKPSLTNAICGQNLAWGPPFFIAFLKTTQNFLQVGYLIYPKSMREKYGLNLYLSLIRWLMYRNDIILTSFHLFRGSSIIYANMWDISVWMYNFFSLAIYTISQPLPCVHDMATINHHFVSWKNVK